MPRYLSIHSVGLVTLALVLAACSAGSKAKTLADVLPREPDKPTFAFFFANG